MKNDRLQPLFKKHVQNNLNAEEAEELCAYIDDPASAVLLKYSISEEMNGFNENEETTQPEVNQIVADLENKVLQSINGLVKKNNIRMRTHWRYAAAAAAIFLIVASAVYWQGTDSRVKENLASSSIKKAIPHVAHGVWLMIAGSKSLALSDERQGVAMVGNQLRYEDGSLLLDDADRQTFTIAVARARKYKIILSDGTKVWLNAASSITYPGNFQGAERVVEAEGEIYFEVAHDSKHPFIVKTACQAIKVLGTAFNVNTYNKGKAVTTLINGRIALSTTKGTLKILSPGEQAIVRGEAVSVRKVNAQDYVGWKDGLIVLDDQDAHDIFKQLERWYDVEFVHIERIAAGKKLSGEIPVDTSLAVILKAIEEQLHVKFEVNGRRIMIKS